MPTLTNGAVTTSLRDFSMSATFQPSQGMFSPGIPLVPTDPQPIRSFDFPAGTNLTWTPRSYEPFGFPALRSFANVEMVRLAIETRKDQVERFEWRVKKIGARKSDPNDPRIVAATKFLRKPDGYNHFAVWMRMLFEDLLALDAPALEIRRTRGGAVAALEVVDGSTIKVLLDSNGRRPLAPEPAYQQVIKGRIWSNLNTDDLIYAPRNIRSAHAYGFGPVEQVIVTVNTLLNRQTAQLAYFTAGNIPAGIINAPAGWTPDQIKQYQDLMDAVLSGNPTNRAKLLMAPEGARYQAFKESPLKDDFDEWLARIIAYAFSLPPTPFIKQMNRATSESDQERAMMEGLQPLLNWAKRLLDGVLQDLLGYPDLEFSWEMAPDMDPETQARINDTELANAARTLNEVRDAMGLDPYQSEHANIPMVKTATGYVPFDAYFRNQERAEAAAAADQNKFEDNQDDDASDAAGNGDE